jgi:hypothetical protein
MKKYLFIIGLWAACVALPNSLTAQWDFTATLREVFRLCAKAIYAKKQE